jgi:hypothetical protein
MLSLQKCVVMSASVEWLCRTSHRVNSIGGAHLDAHFERAPGVQRAQYICYSSSTTASALPPCCAQTQTPRCARVEATCVLFVATQRQLLIGSFSVFARFVLSIYVRVAD